MDARAVVGCAVFKLRQSGCVCYVCDPEAFTFLLWGSSLPDGNGRKSPQFSPPPPASGKQAKSGDDMLEGFCDKIGNELLFEFMIRNPYIVD